MIKYIIIGILIFNAGFIFGSGWGSLKRDTPRIPQEGDMLTEEQYIALQKMLDQSEEWRKD
jgi:hypothetical protein